MAKREAKTILKKESESSTPKLVINSIPENTGRISPDDIYENITKTKHCIKNYRFPDADLLYPSNPELRSVGKFYPMSEGGPLYIDEPMYDEEIKECEKKRAHFKERKLRYLVVKFDTDMISAMEQLGE